MASSVPPAVKSQAWHAAALVAIAGYVDAYGYLQFQAFLSFMSGNTTHTGSRLGEAKWDAAVPNSLAILLFVVGVFAGALLAHSSVLHAERLRLVVVAALLGAVLALTEVGSLPKLLGIGLGSLAMGLMNTTLSRVGGESVGLGYVTGTLNKMASEAALAIRRSPPTKGSAAWDTHAYRALLMFGVWAAFLVGAVVSGAGTVRFGGWKLLLPILVLLVLAVFSPPSPEPAKGGGG